MNQPNSFIYLLEPAVVDQIAAGEVVERPASIVKELVENSLDAGASRIVIEVSEGGKKLVRVSDNGSGMSREDLGRCVLPHATSKIKTIDDLFQVKTMGFRGEALASIAAVSRLEIISRDNDRADAAGNFIKISGGEQTETGEAPAVKGTSVVVRDLFFNLPVRRKFLKKDLTELSYINDLMDQFVLVRPDVSFELIVNGTSLLKTAGRGDPREALGVLYGAGLLEYIKSFKMEKGALKIHGLLSDPVKSWSDKKRQFFFVNGRPVKIPLFFRIIDDSYRHLLPRGRFPLVTAFIELPPEEVDVNIHPRKTEIKFINPSAVLGVFSEALKQALDFSGPTSSVARGWPGPAVSDSGSGPEQFQPGQIFEDLPGGSGAEAHHYQALQLLNTYLIFVRNDKLILVDQHAASERINYEKLLAAAKSAATWSVQRLLSPQTLELSRAEAGFLTENLKLFTDLGFEIELFGADTFLLRGVPAFLAPGQTAELLENVFKDLSETGLAISIEKKQEAVVASLACHSAVRAGDPLNPAQINELLNNLFVAPNYSTCPHGRPTIIQLTRSELEKMFFRT